MSEILSPLTGSDSLVVEKSIPTYEIIRKCKNVLNIDVSYLFNKTEEIVLLKCNQSGYRFYYPFYTSGDDAFYQNISKKDWYYVPWKWEHEQCLSYLKDGMKILEVGAGSGFFLKKVSNIFKDFECVGLELNSIAVSKGREAGVELLKQNIEEHAVLKPAYYDLVISFQVLEHVSDVHSFIQAQIACLRPGGTLIIAVPNNESFIRDITLDAGILNMPPHHMGLWDKNSLSYLNKVFNLNLENILIEPLQENGYDLFQFTVIRRLFCRNDFLAKLFWRLYCKLRLQNLFRVIVKNNSEKIIGHTIIAIFKKA